VPVPAPEVTVKVLPATFVPEVASIRMLLLAPFVNVTLPPNDDVVPTVNVVPVEIDLSTFKFSPKYTSLLTPSPPLTTKEPVVVDDEFVVLSNVVIPAK
jgi:hypothetical protein